MKPEFTGITRFALAVVIVMSTMLAGCEADDAASHEPHAKAQKILPAMDSQSDISYAKDQWDEKQTSQDDAANSKQ